MPDVERRVDGELQDSLTRIARILRMLVLATTEILHVCRVPHPEAAAIFEKAAQAQLAGARELPSGETDGMTLAQLQEIGREVGIDPSPSLPDRGDSVG